MNTELKEAVLKEVDRAVKYRGPMDLPILIHKSMEIVAKYNDLEGHDKKQLVIDVTTALIDKTDLCDPLLPMIPILINKKKYCCKYFNCL